MGYPRFSTLDLLTSVGCFAVTAAWMGYVMSLQVGALERLQLVALCPLTGAGIGAGLGTLFGKLGRGALWGIVLQAWSLIAGLIITTWVAAHWPFWLFS
jgi:hypothetical protein